MTREELVKLVQDTLFDIKDHEIDVLLKEMNTSVDLLNTLEDLDLKAYPVILTSCINENRLRLDDVTRDQLNINDALKNAELAEGDFIKVLKTL